jgi:ABC-2 type transport system permease protein
VTNASGRSALWGFAHHEIRLAWRDWSWLFSGRKNTSTKRALVGIAVFAAILHLIAYAVLKPFFAGGGILDQSALAVVTVSVMLSFTMLLSQAMESVTRAFYARDDLDLILSSPAPSRDLFLVRIAMMGITSWIMSVLLIAPFLNIAAYFSGGSWLAGYLVMLAVALLATGCAVLMTLMMFKSLGAKRTRLIAQIVAAVIGAAFLIGLQMVAIVSYGSMSRFSLFNAEFLAKNAPGSESLIWFPAYATAGEIAPLTAFLGIAVIFFVAAASIGAVQFRKIVVVALGVSEKTHQHRSNHRAFRMRSTRSALVQKELKLIGRDPWLISQTLMQVLYLLPPALMLWVSFGDNTEISVIIAPVVVMAVGQLAGGLAWLTISGEDAPDLIATAPVSSTLRLWAKIQAVLLIVAVLVAPLALGMALVSVWGALVTFAGAISSAGCAILVQLWFRAQANRSLFRRRQVASKFSTFAEAAASILCAGTTALIAARAPLAIVPAVLLILVMAATWHLSKGLKATGRHTLA